MVAPCLPFFCSTNTHVFLPFKKSPGMQSCPRSAGSVRNRTVVLWVGTTVRTAREGSQRISMSSLAQVGRDYVWTFGEEKTGGLLKVLVRVHAYRTTADLRTAMMR